MYTSLRLIRIEIKAIMVLELPAKISSSINMSKYILNNFIFCRIEISNVYFANIIKFENI